MRAVTRRTAHKQKYHDPSDISGSDDRMTSIGCPCESVHAERRKEYLFHPSASRAPDNLPLSIVLVMEESYGSDAGAILLLCGYLQNVLTPTLACQPFAVHANPHPAVSGLSRHRFAMDKHLLSMQNLSRHPKFIQTRRRCVMAL